MRQRKNFPFSRQANLLENPRQRAVLTTAMVLLISLAAISALLLLFGKNPFQALAAFLKGCGLLPKPSYAAGKGMLTDFVSFLDVLAPMLLASLAMVVAFKAGLFNIGVSGQMLLAGFIATIFVGYSGLEAYLAKPLVVLLGAAVGGLLGALVGWLRHRFNIHEVVSTIMFNYIISYVTGFFLNTWYVDTVTRSSRVISAAARLSLPGVTAFGYTLSLPLGLPVAVAAVILVRFLLERTVSGFEIRMVGLNGKCSRYAGVNVGGSVVTAMGVSGALAGLAGVTYYLGYYNTIIPKELPSMGYDSIAVALLGNTSPVGCVFASLLIIIFQKGNVYMSSQMHVSREIASVMTGMLLLFCACGNYLWERFGGWYARGARREGAAPELSREADGRGEG